MPPIKGIAHRLVYLVQGEQDTDSADQYYHTCSVWHAARSLAEHCEVIEIKLEWYFFADFIISTEDKS